MQSKQRLDWFWSYCQLNFAWFGCVCLQQWRSLDNSLANAVFWKLSLSFWKLFLVIWYQLGKQKWLIVHSYNASFPPKPILKNPDVASHEVSFNSKKIQFLFIKFMVAFTWQEIRDQNVQVLNSFPVRCKMQLWVSHSEDWANSKVPVKTITTVSCSISWYFA